MASQMVVPASRDTLFMRGFSARRDIDEIRDFFSEEGGRCSVEFFKESDDKSKLYVALKFENKDIAKELLNKYDNTEVLGDRITISWFKDLRRARFNANLNRGRRSNWSPDRYDKYKNKYYSGGRYVPNRWSSSYGTRGRRYERSYSRSHSRSRSSSRSHSRSRSSTPRRSHSRSRSRSSDSYEERKHRRHHSKKSSHKSDKHKSHDRHSRERSPSLPRHSRDRSDEPDDDMVEKRSKRSMERPSPVKAVQSTIRPVERPAREDSPSDNGSSDEMSISEEDVEKTSSQSFDLPPKQGSQNVSKYVDRGPAEAMNSGQMEKSRPASSKEYQALGNDPSGNIKDRFYSPQPEFATSPPQPPPKSHPPGRYGSELYEKQFERDQEYMQAYKRNKRSSSPSNNRSSDQPAPGAQEKDIAPAANKVEMEYVHSPHQVHDIREMTYGDVRNPRQDIRYSDDHQKVIGNVPPERVHQKQTSDIESPLEKEAASDIGRVPRMCEAPESFDRRLDYDEYRPPVRKQMSYDDKRQHFMETAMPRDSRPEFCEKVSRMEQRKVPMGHPDPMGVDCGHLPPDRGMAPVERVRGPRDNGSHLTERMMDRGPATGRMISNHEPPQLFDDRESSGSSHSVQRNLAPQSFNGGIKEVEKGALGLSQDKMALVREKKDEIEKSYRQDCETFAAVTKMLISKDIWLEDKLQASLRENLKDIGQRCIHELREFIEALKNEGSAAH